MNGSVKMARLVAITKPLAPRSARNFAHIELYVPTGAVTATDRIRATHTALCRRSPNEMLDGRSSGYRRAIGRPARAAAVTGSRYAEHDRQQRERHQPARSPGPACCPCHANSTAPMKGPRRTPRTRPPAGAPGPRRPRAGSERITIAEAAGTNSPYATPSRARQNVSTTTECAAPEPASEAAATRTLAMSMRRSWPRSACGPTNSSVATPASSDAPAMIPSVATGNPCDTWIAGIIGAITKTALLIRNMAT